VTAAASICLWMKMSLSLVNEMEIHGKLAARPANKPLEPREKEKESPSAECRGSNRCEVQSQNSVLFCQLACLLLIVYCL
jgi:hypothetical protein